MEEKARVLWIGWMRRILPRYSYRAWWCSSCVSVLRVTPSANRCRRLKDALDRLLDQLIQERVGPLIMELDDPTLVNPVSS